MARATRAGETYPDRSRISEFGVPISDLRDPIPYRVRGTDPGRVPAPYTSSGWGGAPLELADAVDEVREAIREVVADLAERDAVGEVVL